MRIEQKENRRGKRIEEEREQKEKENRRRKIIEGGREYNEKENWWIIEQIDKEREI